MKSYTDIEQSKTLVEILPMESADMSYRPYREEGGIPDYEITFCPYRFASWIGIPCWSLVALLDVIPYCSLRRFVDGNWIVSAEFSLNGYRESQPNKSAVDACYELILKLKEQKLL